MRVKCSTAKQTARLCETRALPDDQRAHASSSGRESFRRFSVLVAAALAIALIQPVHRFANADDPAAPKAVRAAAQPSAPPNVDSLGDPLPDRALLRLGTLRFRHPSSVIDLALSPDEETVVTIGSGELIAWDANTGKERWRASHGVRLPAASYGIRALTFRADGSRFLTPGRANSLIAWDTLSGRNEILSFENVLPLKSVHQSTTIPAGLIKTIDVTADGSKYLLGGAAGVAVYDADRQPLFAIANNPEAPLEHGRDRLEFGGHYSFGRFSPDGRTLAVTTSDSPKKIRIVDSESGEELRGIDLTAKMVRLAFSPDGKKIVATERDSAVRLYAVESGEEIWSHKIELKNDAESYTSAVAYSPDGTTIAACAPIGSDYLIYLFDAASGKVLTRLSGHEWKPWAAAFTSDSKTFYSSGWDGSVRRWDVAARKQLALPQGIRATCVVAAAPNGKALAYADDRGTIRLVDPRTGTEFRTLELAGVTYGQVTFSPDSRYLAGGGHNDDQVIVSVWDTESGEVANSWRWPKGRDPHSNVESLSFTPDGRRLAAAVFRQSAAYLFDLSTGEQVAQLQHKSVYGLSFSPDGETLATAGWDRIVRFWNAETGELRRELNVVDQVGKQGDIRMYTVCYAPTGGLVATAHLDGVVRIWDTADMKLRKQFQVKGRFVYGSIAFSPDGLWLATGSMAGDITLWDPLTGEEMWNVGRHQHYVYTVGFGRDNRTLVSGADDGVCYLWELQPREAGPRKDLNGLWDDLAGDDGRAAYLAMWAMAETPGETVRFLGDKLRPVTTVIDLDRLGENLSPDEFERRLQLSKRLAKKADTAELLVTVRRAVSVLSELSTPDADRLLGELAEQNPKTELGRLAAAAIRSGGSQE